MRQHVFPRHFAQPLAGVVQVDFDDILVVGSPSIPAHLARVLDRCAERVLDPTAEASRFLDDVILRSLTERRRGDR